MRRTRKDILSGCTKVAFDRFRPYLDRFIEKCVTKEKQDRWRFAARSALDLGMRFNSLWGGIDTNKSHCRSQLQLTASQYLYLDFEGIEEHGYSIDISQVENVLFRPGEWLLPGDGMLFSVDGTQVIFLTHESEYYHFRLDQPTGTRKTRTRR